VGVDLVRPAQDDRRNRPLSAQCRPGIALRHAQVVERVPYGKRATRVQRGHDPGEQRGIGLVAVVVGRDGEARPERKPSADLGEVGRGPPGDDADLRDAEGREVLETAALEEHRLLGGEAVCEVEARRHAVPLGGHGAAVVELLEDAAHLLPAPAQGRAGRVERQRGSTTSTTSPPTSRATASASSGEGFARNEVCTRRIPPPLRGSSSTTCEVPAWSLSTSWIFWNSAIDLS